MFLRIALDVIRKTHCRESESKKNQINKYSDFLNDEASLRTSKECQAE